MQTRDRILDAAERLYAEHGVAATSLRAIMKEAGANMAAVHYHFGSRTGLLEALLVRRAEPVNRRRLALLDEIERRHPDGPLPSRDIIRAFIEPAIEMMENPSHGHIGRLIGRVVMESEETEVVGRVFGPMLQRFIAAVRRAAPHLSEENARRRFQFVIGSMVFALSMQRSPLFDFSPERVRPMIEDLITFAAAGLTAPASEESS
jgi:AcrR family transcriptional regulator